MKYYILSRYDSTNDIQDDNTRLLITIESKHYKIHLSCIEVRNNSEEGFVTEDKGEIVLDDDFWILLFDYMKDSYVAFHTYVVANMLDAHLHFNDIKLMECKE